MVAWNEIQRKYHHALYFSHQLFFAHTDVLNVKNSFKSMEIYLKYFSPVEGILGSNAFRKTLIYFGIFLAYIFNRVIIPIFMFPIALCIYPFHFVLFACLENILPTILFFLAILVYPFLCILFKFDVKPVTGTQKKLVFWFGLGSQKTQNPNPNPDPKYQFFWV